MKHKLCQFDIPMIVHTEADDDHIEKMGDTLLTSVSFIDETAEERGLSPRDSVYIAMNTLIAMVFRHSADPAAIWQNLNNVASELIDLVERVRADAPEANLPGGGQ
jgi:hypothetical protein